MRRLSELAAGLGLTWLALHAAAWAAAPPPVASAPVHDGGSAGTAASAGSAAEPLAPPPEGAAGADPVASYTLHASLDPARHTVEGKGTITWRNASRIAQREIWVHLYLNAYKTERTLFARFADVGSFRGGGATIEHGSITVKRLALAAPDGGLAGGADLWPGADSTSPGDPDDETDIRVPLPAPIEPGQTVRLDVEFESRLPSLSFRTGFYEGFYMVGQWFPKLAVLAPDGRWAHFAFHRLSEFYADFGRYDVTVDTPGDMIVGATGQPAGEVRTGDRVARRFVADSVHDFAFAAWSRFQEISAVCEGRVAVRVLFPPGHARAAAVELDSVREGLRALGDAFGPYPYPTLTVVHPPAGAEEAGGMEYPTLITTGGPWYLPWTGVRALEAVTVHELGHQWFYGLVATDEHAWPFLDEGLNSYAEALVLEGMFPHASGFGGLGLSVSIPAVQRALAAGPERNAPVAQAASDFVSGGDYGALVYNRTATILTTLGRVYGEDAVRSALGVYTRRHRFRHPGPEDLIQALREGVGDDAAAQLRAALFDRATVDYAVERFTSASAPEGRHGHVLVRRRGALRFPVDVELTFADGTRQRLRWDAAASAAELPWQAKSDLVAAVIDPDHRVLLDDDLGNNARSRSPSRVSAALLDRLAFAASVLLADVSP
jgi:hypothetical protein